MDATDPVDRTPGSDAERMPDTASSSGVPVDEALPVAGEPIAGTSSTSPGAPPPSRWRPSRRAVAIQGGIVVLLVAASLLFRDSLSGPADQLAVGDCFDEPPDDGIVLTIQHRPCNGPHDAEVILVRDMPRGGEFPGETVIETFVIDACFPAFEAVLGTPYATDSEHEIGYLAPIEVTWRRGDREVTCYVYRLDGQPMTSPLAGR